MKVEKIGLNRASPEPDRAGIGLDLFSPIGLTKIGLSPIRAGSFRAGSGGPNADPWLKQFEPALESLSLKWRAKSDVCVYCCLCVIIIYVLFICYQYGNILIFTCNDA